MKIRLLALLLFVSLSGMILPLTAQEDMWLTDYEKSGFTETPRLDATIDFCRRLAAYSNWVQYTTFGISPQGRELPLLIIDKHQHFDPQDSDKTILLLQAGIHPGEPDGKDAGLMLIRDMVVHQKHGDLLENITILFIPVFNVDGHERFGPYNRINQNGPKEMGWRTTAQNLNLNRDFIKADAPEMRAWLDLFNSWKPHFMIDCHTTNGADYQYALTYILESFGSMDEHLTSWQNDYYIPAIEQLMLDSGFPVFPYVQFRQWHDPRSGLRSGASPGMLSQGYTGLLNRPGLLIETHMLKDYKTRVDATYLMILHTMEILNSRGKELQQLINAADEYAASPDFRKQAFPLEFSVSPTDSIMVEFLGVEYEAIESTLTGGKWFRYYPERPVTFNLPYFRKNSPSAMAELPEAYIVPAEWTEVIQRIEAHGIQMLRITNPLVLEVASYRFENPVWRSTPFEGRHTVKADLEPITEKRTFETGSVIITMSQPSARLIARMLEPGGYDSFLQWGFFNAIFEQKEYAENYVMEPLALKMLESDPALRTEFESIKAANPDFLKNQWNVLNWFYQRSPYADQRLNVYPVGKIRDLNKSGLRLND